MLALCDHFDIPGVAGKQLIGFKISLSFFVTTHFADPVCTTVWETSAFYFFCHLVCSYGLLGMQLFILYAYQALFLWVNCIDFQIEERFTDTVQVLFVFLSSHFHHIDLELRI